MPLSGDYKSGHTGTLKVGGYTLPTKTFGYKTTAKLFDVSNARSGNVMERIGGRLDVSGQAECVWDDDQYPNAAPVEIIAGQIVTFEIKHHADSTPFSFDAIIETVEVPQIGQDGELKYTFNWFAQGTVNFPTS